MVSPREMKNTTLDRAMKLKSPVYVFRHHRGEDRWERINSIVPWGGNLLVNTVCGEFVEGRKYVVYRPSAKQREQIEAMK